MAQVFIPIDPGPLVILPGLHLTVSIHSNHRHGNIKRLPKRSLVFQTFSSLPPVWSGSPIPSCSKDQSPKPILQLSSWPIDSDTLEVQSGRVAVWPSSPVELFLPFLVETFHFLKQIYMPADHEKNSDRKQNFSSESLRVTVTGLIAVSTYPLIWTHEPRLWKKTVSYIGC